MTFTFGSLFSGIGGIDLGLEWAGMDPIWQAEIEPYCCRVLKKHWPAVPNLGDVRLIDWSAVARPNLIAGGYPCQPFSQAGKRQGLEDPRHVWPYFATALRHLRPTWALLENVPGHLSLGFSEVQADLAALGYDTQWESIPASAVGAPHLRYRVFLVAYSAGNGDRGEVLGDQAGWPDPAGSPGGLGGSGDGRGAGDVADPYRRRRLRRGQPEPAGVEGARRGVTDGRRPVRKLKYTPPGARDVADADSEQLRDQPRGVPAPPGAREGQGAQWQRIRADTGHGGTTVADAGSQGLALWQGQRGHDGAQRQAAQRGGGGADVADPQGVALGTGLRPNESRRLRRGRPRDGSGEVGAVADADRPRPPDPGGASLQVPGPGQELRPQRRSSSQDMADADEVDARHRHDGAGPLLPGPHTVPEGARHPLPDPDQWEFEPDVGRVANGVPSRVDRLRGLGNAVVPQVAHWVGHQILEAEAARYRLLDIYGQQ